MCDVVCDVFCHSNLAHRGELGLSHCSFFRTPRHLLSEFSFDVNPTAKMSNYEPMANTPSPRPHPALKLAQKKVVVLRHIVTLALNCDLFYTERVSLS